MKKNKFVKLALLGLANGLIINSPTTLSAGEQLETFSENEARALLASTQKNFLLAAKCGGPGGCGTTAARDIGSTKLQDPSTTSIKSPSLEISKDTYGTQNLDLTEEELLEELSAEGKKQYQGLSPSGKALARKMASQTCNGNNYCKGQNACETETNKCAGKGKCKGMSKCAFGDKNLAVKIAAQIMAEKRSGTLQNHSR